MKANSAGGNKYEQPTRLPGDVTNDTFHFDPLAKKLTRGQAGGGNRFGLRQFGLLPPPLVPVRCESQSRSKGPGFQTCYPARKPNSAREPGKSLPLAGRRG